MPSVQIKLNLAPNGPGFTLNNNKPLQNILFIAGELLVNLIQFNELIGVSSTQTKLGGQQMRLVGPICSLQLAESVRR